MFIYVYTQYNTNKERTALQLQPPVGKRMSKQTADQSFQQLYYIF